MTLHRITYYDSTGLMNVFELPVATDMTDEPVMDGFENVAMVADHEADFVLIEDWLDAFDGSPLDVALVAA